MSHVTICIPAYNAEKTIGETLDSLLAQTFRDFEIVVSDNHSTDSTRELVGSYASSGVKLVVCPAKPPVGAGTLTNCIAAIQNWNSLPNLGNGEYLSLCHADDVYDSRMLETQVKALESNVACIAVFPTIYYLQAKRSDRNVDRKEFTYNFKSLTQLELIREMLRVGHNISSSGPMFKRSCWIAAGQMDATRYEQAADTEFWLRLSAQGKICILTPALVGYRIHEGQDSSNGLILYKFRPLPIIPVLRQYYTILAKSGYGEKSDEIHLAASITEEDLRVAINLIRAERWTEAKSILASRAGFSIWSLFVLIRAKRKVAALRIIAISVLSMAVGNRMRLRIANAILSSRIGYSQWRNSPAK